jgi:hypothetical protein
MKFFRKVGGIVAFLFFILSNTFAQESSLSMQAEGSAPFQYRQSVDSAYQLYGKAMWKPYGQIIGREYKPYFYPNHSSPYLMSGQGIGTIYMDGVSYPNNILFYDINLDELILVPSKVELSGYYIKLKKAEIDSFIIHYKDHEFCLVNMSFESDSVSGMKAGYYEIPYSGKYRYLIKHFVYIGQKDGHKQYEYQKSNYLYKDGRFHEINSKREFLSLFAQSRKLLKKRIKQNMFKYKDLTKPQMIQLIKFAETI